MPALTRLACTSVASSIAVIMQGSSSDVPVNECSKVGAGNELRQAVYQAKEGNERKGIGMKL